jgi:hypothetical protein
MLLEIITYAGLILWFVLWWARFIVQRHNVQSSGSLKDKLLALATIKTHEIVSAKRGITGRKTYQLHINRTERSNSNAITGDYIVEFTSVADKRPMTAFLSLGIIFWILLFTFDNILYHRFSANFLTMVGFHLFMSLIFPWMVYKQVFYDMPKAKGLFKFVARRPIIRSIPSVSILLILFTLDICRQFSFTEFTNWVEGLHAAPSVEALMLRVPVWSFGAFGSFYLKLRKMYHQHCDIVGIVEDPQIMYWILAVPATTSWFIATVWAA